MASAVLADFRRAAWSSRDELKRFVEGAGRLPPQELIGLLAVLREPRAVAQGPLHKNRCFAFAALAKSSANPALFAPAVDALGSADAVLRRVLIALLPRINDVQRHESLCRLLDHEDPELRAAVAEQLTQLAGPSALAHLTAMVAERDFQGRLEAMRCMLARARHRAVPLVVTVLQRGDPRERVLALRHLADPELAHGDPGVVTAVRRALVDPDRRVAAEAFAAFGKLVDEHVFFDELAHLLYTSDVDPAVVRSLGSYDSPRALELLAHKVRVGPNVVRIAAIDALEKIATDGAVPVMVAAVHVPDPTVRTRATEALSNVAQSGAVDLALAIIALLRSGVPDVRRIGAHLARSARDDEGEFAGRLLGFLKDEDWWVRERVLDALIELMGSALTPHLAASLDDESPVLRRFAIAGLVRLRDPGALGAVLSSANTDDDWWVREQAVLATAQIGDARAIPYLEKLARDRADLRLASLEALEALGAHDELLALADLAGDDDANVRRAVVTMLANLPRGREASFYVQACVDDDDARVARLARETLADWEVEVDREVVTASMGVLDRLLVSAVRAGADDVLLAAGRPPAIKRLGAMAPAGRGSVTGEELLAMVGGALTPGQRRALDDGSDIDFSYEVTAFGLRFRVNLFRQLTGLAAVFRHVKQELPDIESLGLPSIVRGFADYGHGLVLVGGPTGSGKSTTLAALIDHINRSRARHIVTIEDPIEVLHPRQESLVNQREVGAHTHSFANALRATLRQDPDVILVGELRDLETIEFAVNAAETGHLVLGTVHTSSADTSVDRMIHAFPAAQQPLVRSMLAESLRAVVCQQLLRRVDQPGGRALAAEVMINNDAISNLVRKGKCFQIPSVIATHRDVGMMLMDEELETLVRRGVVDAEEALAKSVNKQAFAGALVEAGFLSDSEQRSTLQSYRPPAQISSFPPPRPSSDRAPALRGPSDRPARAAPGRASRPAAGRVATPPGSSPGVARPAPRMSSPPGPVTPAPRPAARPSTPAPRPSSAPAGRRPSVPSVPPPRRSSTLSPRAASRSMRAPSKRGSVAPERLSSPPGSDDDAMPLRDSSVRQRGKGKGPESESSEG